MNKQRSHVGIVADGKVSELHNGNLCKVWKKLVFVRQADAAISSTLLDFHETKNSVPVRGSHPCWRMAGATPTVAGGVQW